MRAVKALMVACLLAVVASVSVQTMRSDVTYSFNNGEFLVFSVPYTETPCEEHYYGTTVDWDGGSGFCEFGEATVAAAKAGDKRFSPRALAVILKATRLSSGKMGSLVSILD